MAISRRITQSLLIGVLLTVIAGCGTTHTSPQAAIPFPIASRKAIPVVTLQGQYAFVDAAQTPVLFTTQDNPHPALSLLHELQSMHATTPVIVVVSNPPVWHGKGNVPALPAAWKPIEKVLPVGLLVGPPRTVHALWFVWHGTHHWHGQGSLPPIKALARIVHGSLILPTPSTPKVAK